MFSVIMIKQCPRQKINKKIVKIIVRYFQSNCESIARTCIITLPVLFLYKPLSNLELGRFSFSPVRCTRLNLHLSVTMTPSGKLRWFIRRCLINYLNNQRSSCRMIRWIHGMSEILVGCQNGAGGFTPSKFTLNIYISSSPTPSSHQKNPHVQLKKNVSFKIRVG